VRVCSRKMADVRDVVYAFVEYLVRLREGSLAACAPCADARRARWGGLGQTGQISDGKVSAETAEECDGALCAPSEERGR
jgi:hypothetical protein